VSPSVHVPLQVSKDTGLLQRAEALALYSGTEYEMNKSEEGLGLVGGLSVRLELTFPSTSSSCVSFALAGATT